MLSYIRPLCEGRFALRALMQSALPLLNNAVASQAGSSFRVWESRSTLACHQRDHTLHRAAGYLNLLMAPARCHPLGDRRLDLVYLSTSFLWWQGVAGIIGSKSSPALRMNSRCTWRPREGSR